MFAPDRARSEADRWMFTLSLVDLLAAGWHGPPPSELAVTGHDPAGDLTRRSGSWSHAFSDHSLSSLLAFGAALATAEADAWDADDPVTATQALSDRRFLLGDRILHWAVPWLVTVGSKDSEWAPEAMAATEALLALGDLHRVAPVLTEIEGLVPPGYDSIGEIPRGLAVSDLAGGWLFEDHTIQVGPEPYEAAAALWDDLAKRHPGSARLWVDLAARARQSAAQLTSREDD